jgi:hypothetical protein
MAGFLLTPSAMGSVLRHWRWLACSALAVGCLLNPQPDLPGSRPAEGDNSGGSPGSGVAIGGGGTSASSAGAGPGDSAGAGGPQNGAGGAPLTIEEGGMGGAVEFPAAGATGESGAAGALTAPPLGPGAR